MQTNFFCFFSNFFLELKKSITFVSNKNFYTMETMIIEKNIEITQDAIESTLVTAIEGGIDYWCYISLQDKRKASLWLEKEIEGKRLTRDKFVHYGWMDAMFQGYPNSIRIFDVEEAYEAETYEDFDDLEPIGYLSMENIKKGLQKASVEYPNQFNQFFPEYVNGDACDADIIFQLICLDDVVYG
jgi:hypothetical protein